MFFQKKTESLIIAEKLIKKVDLDENLKLLKQKNHTGTVEPDEFLNLILALGTCNLVQTMKADFIQEKLQPALQYEITRDYVKESLDRQKLIKIKSAEAEEKFYAVMRIVSELQMFWKESEDPTDGGPGPRYYCVKEILKRIGGETNYELHDALFELMYLQHKNYIDFFKGRLVKPA